MGDISRKNRETGIALISGAAERQSVELGPLEHTTGYWVVKIHIRKFNLFGIQHNA